MRTIGIALLIVWISVRISSASEPSLGDRRLFFSEQERQAMGKEGKNSDSATLESGKEIGTADKTASASMTTQSSLKLAKKISDQNPAFVVNGFIEASNFLTLFVNGMPCERLSLVLGTPKKFTCAQLADQLLTPLTLERMDEHHIAVRLPGGKIYKLSRQSSK